MSRIVIVILIYHHHKPTDLIYHHTHNLLDKSQPQMLLAETLTYVDPKLFVLIMFFNGSFLIPLY
jgi:hypothetical protein